jgi:hypothetical protein
MLSVYKCTRQIEPSYRPVGHLGEHMKRIRRVLSFGLIITPFLLFLCVVIPWRETQLFRSLGGPIGNGFLAIGFGLWLVRYNNRTSMIVHYYPYRNGTVGVYFVNTGKTTIPIYRIWVDGKQAENIGHDISLKPGEIHRCTLVEREGNWFVDEAGRGSTTDAEFDIQIESADLRRFTANKHKSKALVRKYVTFKSS